jgi:crotonobetaine/carnitine-CoA ligase
MDQNEPLTTDRILPNLIARIAAEEPDRPFIEEVTGRTCTYGELDALARCWAAAFRRRGIGAGDHVLTMIPPRIDWMAAWMGLCHLQAVDVGVNTEFQGEMLRYALAKAEASVILIASEFAGRFDPETLKAGGLGTVIFSGSDPATELDGPEVFSVNDFLAGCDPPCELRPSEPWDIPAMTLTSGTTGPSKYVLAPWGVHYTGAMSIMPPASMTPDDAWYQPLPIYHMAARFGIYAMALARGRLVFRDRFSLHSFWPDIRKYRCTVTQVTPFARMLWDADPKDDDTDNPLRAVMMGPLHPRYREFGERFGIRLRTAFGSTEIGVPICAGFDPPNAKTCGRPVQGYPGVEARLVDEHDHEVQPGQVGELVLRTERPWALMVGYFNNPGATARAWRNGWFHTGDAFRQDEDGLFYFVDRLKDTIRRRGENISSFEIEAAVNAHPAVRESAAVAVPEPGEEDEIKVFVVLSEGESLSHEELIRFLAKNLPRFMVPRYVQFIDELPKTEATWRVKKAILRELVGGPAWDRLAHPE